jgi:hypothetical protein
MLDEVGGGVARAGLEDPGQAGGAACAFRATPARGRSLGAASAA